MATLHAGMSSASPQGHAGVYQNQLCPGSGICPFQEEPSAGSQVLGQTVWEAPGMQYLNCSLPGAERGGEHSPFWMLLCQNTFHPPCWEAGTGHNRPARNKCLTWVPGQGSGVLALLARPSPSYPLCISSLPEPQLQEQCALSSCLSCSGSPSV